MVYTCSMRKVPTHYKERGDKTEKVFAAWLDRSVLPYLYIEQSQLTVPKELRGEIKRADYIVGLPLVGSVSVDVKCKDFRNDQMVFNAYEFRNLANYQTFFMSSVWMACYEPDDMNICYLFLNEWLLCEKIVKINGDDCARMHRDDMVRIDTREMSFQQALLMAIDLR